MSVICESLQAAINRDSNAFFGRRWPLERHARQGHKVQLPNPNSRGPTISYVQNVFPTSWQSFSEVVASGGRLFTCCYQPEVHSDSCRRWIRSKIRSGNRLFHVGNSFLFVAVVSTAPPQIHLIRHTFISFHFDRCNIIQNKKHFDEGIFAPESFAQKPVGNSIIGTICMIEQSDWAESHAVIKATFSAHSNTITTRRPAKFNSTRRDHDQPKTEPKLNEPRLCSNRSANPRSRALVLYTLAVSWKLASKSVYMLTAALSKSKHSRSWWTVPGEAKGLCYHALNNDNLARWARQIWKRELKI